METVEYILRIVLRLRDEASKKLAAIRAEVKGLGKDADASRVQVERLNSSVSGLTRNLQDRVGELKSVIRQLGDDDDFDRITQAVERTAGKLHELGILRDSALTQGNITIRTQGGAQQEQPSVARDIVSRVEGVIQRSQEAFRNREDREDPIPKPTQEQLDELFRVVEGVNKAGKKTQQVFDALTGDLLGSRRKQDALDRLISKLYTERVIQQRREQREQDAAFDRGAMLDDQRRALDTVARELGIRNDLVDRLKEEIAARQEATAQEQRKAAVTPQAERPNIRVTEQAREEQVAETDAERNQRERNAEFDRLRARASELGIQTEDRSIAVLEELIRKREREIEEIDRGITVMKGTNFSIQQAGSRYRVIDEQNKRIAARNFQSQQAALDRIDEFVTFNVRSNEERKAQIEALQANREATQQETAIKKQTIDVSNPLLADYDKLHKGQQDYVDSLEVQVLKIKQVSDKASQITTRLQETDDRIINLVETVDKAGKVTSDFQQILPRVAGGTPGGTPLGGGDDPFRNFEQQFDKFVEGLRDVRPRIEREFDHIIEGFRIDDERSRSIEERFSPHEAEFTASASSEDIAKLREAAERLHQLGTHQIEVEDDLEGHLTSIRESLRLTDLANRLELGEQGLMDSLRRMQEDLAVAQGEAGRSAPQFFGPDDEEEHRRFVEANRDEIEVVNNLSQSLRDGLITIEEYDEHLKVVTRDLDDQHLRWLRFEADRAAGIDANPMRDAMTASLESQIANFERLLHQQREALFNEELVADANDPPRRRPPIGGGTPGGEPFSGDRNVVDELRNWSTEDRRQARVELSRLLDTLREELRRLPAELLQAFREGNVSDPVVGNVMDRMQEAFRNLRFLDTADRIVSRPDIGERGIQVEQRRNREVFRVVDEEGRQLSGSLLEMAQAEKFLDIATKQGIESALEYQQTLRDEAKARRAVNSEALKEIAEGRSGLRPTRQRDERGRFLPREEQVPQKPEPPAEPPAPPIKPPTVKRAVDFFDDDQDKALQKHQRTVNNVNATFERLVTTLDFLRHNFGTARISEEDFFGTAEKVRKEIDALVRKVPVDFAPGTNLANSMRKVSAETQNAVERFKQLRDSDTDLGALFRGAEEAIGHVQKFKDGFDELANSIDMSRGAAQIFRRENEQFKAMGMADLAEDLFKKRAELWRMEQTLRGRQRRDEPTKTLERDIQRLQSRIQAMRESLRQMVQVESTPFSKQSILEMQQAHEAGIDLSVDRSGLGIVSTEDNEKASEFDDNLRSIGERARHLIQHRDIFGKPNDINVIIEGLRKLNTEYQNLGRAYQADSAEFRFVTTERLKLVEQLNFLVDIQKRKQDEEAAVLKLVADAERQSNREREKSMRIVDEQRAKLNELNDAQVELLRRRREGNLETEDFVAGLKNISRGFQQLANAQRADSEEYFAFLRSANSIARQAREIEAEDKRQRAEELRLETDAEKASLRARAAEARERIKLAEGREKDINTIKELRESFAQLNFEIENGAAPSQRLAQEFAQIAQRAQRIAPNFGPIGSEGRRDVEDFAREARTRGEAVAALDVSKLEQEREFVQRIVAAYERLNHQFENNGVSLRDARAEFARYRQEFGRLARGFEVGSEEARHFGNLAEDAGDKGREALKRFNREQAATGNLIERTVARLNNAGISITSMGENVAKIDNQLRGLLVLAIFAFAQQLLTALTGLAGAFGAVAASAAFAGAGIGSAFVSGIAQALPAIGLMVAALSQVKEVTDAITQAELLRQQGFHRGNIQKDAQLDQQRAARLDAQRNAADQLSNAEDGLRSAHDRVGEANQRLDDAQQSLTDAREEARRKLQDLIQAERDAELAARGAVLDQAEAQDRLSQAISSGSNIDFQRAQLDVASADFAVGTTRRASTRAREELDAGSVIERTDQVVQAKRQVEDAKKGVDDAEQSVVKAERALNRAARAADNAGARARLAGIDNFSAADKLLFMLQQLSPAQLRLFVQLQNIRADFIENFTPITDIIVDSFARAVGTADRILKSAPFLETARGMATAIAGAFDAIRIHFFEDPSKLAQMFRIIQQGTENIAPLESIVENIGDAFLNIAEAGGDTALPRIIGYVDDLTEDIATLTEDRDKLDRFFDIGTDHALAWADLAKNIVIMFATLANAGGADEGLSLVEDLNKEVQDATNWIRDNRREVGQFFEDSGEVARTLAGLIFALGQAVLQVFSPDKLQTFVTFLEQAVIPGLVIATQVIGTLVNLLLSLFSLNVFGFPIGKILSFISAFAIAATVLFGALTSAVGAFAFFLLQFGHGLEIIGKFVGVFGKLNGVMGRFVGILAEMAGKRAALVPLAGVLGAISRNLLGRRGATAPGSILDDLVDIGSGPRTPDGRRVTRSRKGILGKLGLGKVIAEEGDDAVKAAQGVATKSAGRFSGSFLLRAGSLLKGFGWTSIGFAVAEGVITGIKTGNIGAAVQDFAHSLSFGLIDSAEEKAKKAADAIKKEFTDAGGALDLPTPAEIRQAQTALRPPQQGLVAGRGVPINPVTVTNQAAQRDRLKDQEGSAARFLALVEKIRRVSPEAADALMKLPDLSKQLKVGTRRNEVNSFFEDLRRQAGLTKEQWGKQFPQIAGFVDQFQKDVDKSMGKVQERLKPQKIALDLTFDIARLDWDKIKPKDWKENWKGLVDDALAQTKGMKPGAIRHTRETVFAMVDQLVKNKHLPQGAAKQIKDYVVDETEEMRKKAARKSRQTREALQQNIGAAAITVQAYIGAMGTNVNKILDAFGVGKVRLPQTPRGAGQLAGTVAGLAGSLFGGGGDDRRRGGIIGVRPFAAGGVSRVIGKVGERGKDTVLAALGRGEMVFNHFHQRYIRPAVESFYGHPLEDVFKRIRGEHAGPPEFRWGGIPRFATGTEGVAQSARSNLLDGHPGNIAPALMRLLELLKRRFPEAVVTSTTDHSLRTSTGGVSDHSTGHAFDISGPVALMARMVRFINSSGLWRQLKQGIHNPGLAVNQGQRVSGPGFFQNAWPQHVNHIHLAIGDVLRGAFRNISTRLRRQVFDFPVRGPIRELGQRMLDRVRRAGQRVINRRLREAGGNADMDKVDIPRGGNQRSIIQRAARAAGIPARYLWGVYGAETNFGRNIATSTAGAQGPFQFMPGTADAYVPGGRANINNFAAAAVGAARYLKYLFNIFKSWPEAIGHYNSGPGGNLTNPETAAYIPKVLRYAQSFRRGGVPEFEAGGVVPGGDGTPVGIVAHAGEWMLNKVQQSQVARWLGTSREALRARLGFSGGPTHYAGGGEIPTIRTEDNKINASFTTEADRRRIQRIRDGIFALPMIAVRSWEGLVKEADLFFKAVSVIGNRLARGVSQAKQRTLRTRFILAVDRLTKENGLLDQMDAARERLSTQLENGLSRMSLKLVRFTSNGKRSWRVEKVASGVDIADRELSNSRIELDRIIGERGVIVDALKKVNTRLRQLRRGGVTREEGNEFAALTQQQNNLKDRLSKITTDQQSAIQDVFDKQVARQQAIIDSINKRAERREQGFGIRERLATVFGDQGGLQQIAKERIESMQTQMAQLQRRVRRARRTGDTDLVNSLTDQIDDLRASIAEAMRAQVQAGVDAINNAASTRETALGIRQRIAELFGNTGALAQIATERVDSIRSQIGGLQGQLDEANRRGYTDLAASIQSQIDDLNASIKEVVTASFQQAIDSVNSTSQRRLGRLDLFGRMADALGVVGLGGGVSVGGETLSRGQLFGQRAAALGTQRSELQRILREVQTNPETRENMALIQSLTDQLAELDVTIAENTKAAFQARVDDVNAQASFGLNILSLQQRIAELTGTINSTDSSAQVLGLLQQRAVILEQQNNSLNALLTEARGKGDQQAINDLTTQLLENQIATLENTQAINQLSGNSNLQDFSSSAWQQFRQAIFDGLGNLLPHYAMAVPSAAVGAKVMQSGIIKVHSGEEIVPADIVRRGGWGGPDGGPMQINTEVNLSNPTEVADPVYLGNAIGWRIANNPNLRP